jgi:asparagine synthase (glutamine-hydrolysing)
MCGIAGIVGDADKRRIAEMVDILAHRGPNGSGVETFTSPQVALGHRRLSILDLSERGRQPMSDMTGRYSITFNGEIYNFAEIRSDLEKRRYCFRSHTDTEVLLNAFIEWGPDCLKRMNGMFAFAIWDVKDKTLFAARDRLGIKPFYYFHRGDIFGFSSEIKALLASGLVAREIDYLALHTPALYQASPLTGFKNILKLPPAHSLTFKDGQLSINRYWSVAPAETEPPLDESIERLDSLLNDAVRLQMVSDVPVGAFLSGGLDSSLIVALMQKCSGQKTTTFTIRYSDEDQKFERMPDDSYYARKVANLFGCAHNELTIEPDIEDLLPKMTWHLDEPLSDPATINTYLISKMAKDGGIPVLLNGMGGDEIFGGYRSQLACLIADRYRNGVPEFARNLISFALDKLPAATQRGGIKSVRWAKRFATLAAIPGDDRYVFIGMMDPETYQSMFSWDHLKTTSIWDHPHTRAIKSRLDRDGLSYLTRMCLADTEVYLPDHNLTYSDKCTMAASVEGRPPLTDHRLVEFMFSLGPRYRISGKTQKFLLKKVAEKYLPDEIIYRPKAPFGAPLRSWIRGALAEMVGDYLSADSLRRRGIYNPAFVAKAIEDDRSGRKDNSHLIWRMLCNEVWLRTFFS